MGIRGAAIAAGKERRAIDRERIRSGAKTTLGVANINAGQREATAALNDETKQRGQDLLRETALGNQSVDRYKTDVILGQQEQDSNISQNLFNQDDSIFRNRLLAQGGPVEEGEEVMVGGAGPSRCGPALRRY